MYPGRHSMRGSAMFLALMILIVLTLLGVFASSSGVMQERMTGNFRDSERAFEAAEAGLRWHEAWLASIRNPLDRPLPCQSNCGQGVVWEVGQFPPDLASRSENEAPWTFAFDYGHDPVTGAQIGGGAGELDPALPIIAEQPKVLIEEVYFFRDTLATNTTGVNFYRLTSRASGGIQSHVAVVESTFARRFE